MIERLKKIDFRKGTGTFVIGYFLMIMCLIIAVVLLDQYSRYDRALTTQIAADSVADGTAVYSTTIVNADEDAFYEDAMDRTEKLKTLIEDETGIEEISNIEIDRNKFSDDNDVALSLETQNPKLYGAITNNFVYEVPNEDYRPDYFIRRSATTHFEVNPMMLGNGDPNFFTNPTDFSSYSSYMSALTYYAQSFVGNPYVFGGSDLMNGIDCSAFVQQVYRHFGVNINRTTITQQANGTNISSRSESDLQIGDCLYVINGIEDHVVMYIGNGQVVHASNSRPYPAGGIKISPLSYYLNRATSIKRFITEEEFNNY